MPGLVALGRRWSYGSDDLVFPGCVLLVVHIAWLIGLSIVLSAYPPKNESCSTNLHNFIIGSLLLFIACILVESLIVYISIKGTIFYTRPRSSMEYLLYGRTALLLLCLLWSVVGIVWLVKMFHHCPVEIVLKNSVLGIVVYNLLLFILIVARAWCLFDSAGRSFVKMKRAEKQCAMRRSASRVERNRVCQLKTRALYEQNWEKRFHRYCCCIQVKETQESAFTEIGLLFSSFFQDLDIVPSDIVAGLMLLREEQKQSRRAVERNPNNNVIKYLSGVPITDSSKFLDFSNHDECQEFEELIYYYKYAAAAYGWPVYAMFHPARGCCQLVGGCSCCRASTANFEFLDLAEDNCCRCNFTALKKLSGLDEADVVFATFHSAVSSSDLRHRPAKNPSEEEEFGLDTEGLTLVGSPTVVTFVGPGSSKVATTLTTTDESGICLETSLTFQEEMDERCLRGDGRPVSADRGRRCTDRARSCVPACLCPSWSQEGTPSPRLSSADSSGENVDRSMLWETPFFVALDHSQRKVIISVRGTLSMQDWLTDLSADTSEIPLQDSPSDWFGHKGMVGAAVHIKKRLQEELILSRAFSQESSEHDTRHYDLVLVGHSLGAGTVSILSILLRPDYPNLQCYAYSPPGGLLSMPAVEYTKDFVTSLVIGKDIVARVGLSQMEFLRADLLDCIKRSTDPKWKIILDGLLCCREINPKNLTPRDSDDSPSPPRMAKALHPTNLSVLLTTHNPLYPPGKILQIVRTNPKREGLNKRDCAWYAIWRENTAFEEVLISPVMIGDHLPKNVMNSLQKCLQYGRLHGPPKFSTRHGCRPKKDLKFKSERSSDHSSPSSCLELNVPSPAAANPHADINFNDVQRSDNSSLPEQAKRLSLILDGTTTAGHHQRDGIRRTGSSSPVYASYESLPQFASEEGKAPLAQFDTMSDVGSMSSFQSDGFRPQPLPPHRTHDGYCYYVNEDLKSPVTTPFRTRSGFDRPDTTRNKVTTTTTAQVEPKPEKRASRSLSDKFKLNREGSSQFLDRYGNVKGRTSTSDRYKLTYDSGSQSSGNEGAVRPERLVFVGTNRSSCTSSGNQSTDASPSTPEALLGQTYTCYHSLSLNNDSSPDDFDDDFPTPTNQPTTIGAFQQGGGLATDTTGLPR